MRELDQRVSVVVALPIIGLIGVGATIALLHAITVVEAAGSFAATPFI